MHSKLLHHFNNIQSDLLVVSIINVNCERVLAHKHYFNRTGEGEEQEQKIPYEEP